MRTDRDAFVAARKARWDRLDELVRGAQTAEDWSQLASDYRAVCADLAEARAEGLPLDVQTFLDDLAGRAHNQLYGQRQGTAWSIWHDIAVGFPQEIRRQWRFFALSSFLFYGPFFVGAFAALVDPSFAGIVLPESQLQQMEEMYADSIGRPFGGDATMAGFYVRNNVGIAFRCFATGALAGLGSVFFLIYNGLLIGTVFGYLGSVGLGGNLLEFVSGHSAWELTGVCVSGAAGLKMGWALVATDGRTRGGSLRAAGPALYRLVLGTAVLLFVAAAIEGFWSASPVPRTAKYLFGTVQWVIVFGWILLGGRR